MFKDNIQKVKNHDLYYEAVRFYLEEHPGMVNDLLAVIREKVDPARVRESFRQFCLTCAHGGLR